jgi:hypothetical protein
MKLAQAKADIQLLDDAENVAQIEQEEGWDLVALKGKYIGIKTSTLDDKFMAIELISVYAQNLDAGFAPYVLEAMETVALPSLAFFFHDPVRVAAAKAVPQLLNSYKVAYGVGSAEYANLWKGTIEKVLEVLETEPAIETLAEMYQCFYESVEVSGKDCMSNEHMSTFITSAETVLKDYQTRVTERAQEAAERDDGEEPSEAFEFAVEDDQTLLSDMNKAFHTLFKHQSTSFLPHWERLLSYYAHFVASPDDPTQRQWALCILDDVLEFCGPASWHYHTHIVQPLVTGMRDDAPANRQAACYGAGVAAHKGGEPWAEFAAGSLPILFSVVARPDARSEDDVFATENACASIAKVLHFNRSKVENVQECVNAWVDTLPVVNDEEAAPFAYGFLAGLIDEYVTLSLFRFPFPSPLFHSPSRPDPFHHDLYVLFANLSSFFHPTVKTPPSSPRPPNASPTSPKPSRPKPSKAPPPSAPSRPARNSSPWPALTPMSFWRDSRRRRRASFGRCSGRGMHA